jgi:hypothetical protein
VDRSNTKKAFVCLLVAGCYIAVLCVFSNLLNLDYIYTALILRALVIGPWVILLLCAPFVILCLGIAGVVYDILALRARESKVKNIIMMVISASLAILAVLTGIVMVIAALYG